MRSNIIQKKKTYQKQHVLSKTLENRKIAKTRRQRGYNWEDTLVKRFNELDSWKAFRLGSPSVALPDILCVNNHDSKIFTRRSKRCTSRIKKITRYNKGNISRFEDRFKKCS